MVDSEIVQAPSEFWSPARRRDALVIILTLVTGSTDAIGLLRLGGVFTSVMTGNMVFLGIAAGEHSGTIALHTGWRLPPTCSVASLAHGSRDTHRRTRPTCGRSRSSSRSRLSWASWWCSPCGGSCCTVLPSTHVTYALLGLNAVALGVQSSAVLRFGVHGLSTTYLTGTLTQFVAGFTKRDLHVRSGLILLALIVGAFLGAVTALHAPLFAPLVPIGALRSSS